MNVVNRQFVSDQSPHTHLSEAVVKVLDRIKRADPLKVIWWCLALSILSGTVIRYDTQSSGLAYHAMLIMSTGGCAWFWLLSRALFSDHQALHSKALLLVIGIIAIRSVDMYWTAANFNGAAGELFRIFSNVASVVCIASIACVWYESLGGLNRIRSKAERRFRILFPILFSLLFAVAVFWLMGAEPDSFAAQHKTTILNISALIGLVGSRLAVEYRLRTTKTQVTSHAVKNSGHLESCENLAVKVLQAISDDALLTQANLKVADLAKHLGEQEYKVTRCITSQLQFRNFNHLVNHHRIERAIGLFKDPNNNHLNVATIAYDCGFNSLGPFNRAFKQHTSLTPRDYRKQLRVD